MFRLASDGTETVLYPFESFAKGWQPSAALLMDGQGNLYGTTIIGGSRAGPECKRHKGGCGVVFELKAAK